MSYPYSLVKTAVTGDLLAASDYNTEHQNHINNNDPSSINDASSNTSAMQATTSPGGIGTESLATDLLGEIQRIRYVLNRIVGKGTQWYDAPDSDIHTLYGLNPTGTVHWFAGAKTTIPSGWLYCDGSAISRSSYANLFSIIGTAHGQGDGSTTFNLPDLRGRFIRGQDDGAGRDPDAASRTRANTQGNLGDAVGSVQADIYGTHNHPATSVVTDPGHVHTENYTSGAGANASILLTSNLNLANKASASITTASASTGISVATTTTNQGGNETRPLNVGLVGIIKS